VDYWLSNENGEPVQTLTTEVLERKQARALKALKALDWRMT
jgi:hypothetical protein